MQKYFFSFFLLCNSFHLQAQYDRTEADSPRFFVGSSLFVLYNLIPDDNAPDFAQLNFGYRLDSKNTVSIEIKTWKYAWPLGIPYGPDKEAPATKFPGIVREFGAAAAYQHFWWKGLYTGVHVMAARQIFLNEAGNKISNGFQIFNTYRAGYHLKIFRNRFFIEPSLAVTHRPYHSKMPTDFKQQDDRWSKFFIGEPGLHFGFNF